ncbi:DNA polymerase III subunit beta [Candidatus Uhrbacteria bacterium]|nr:DNA polymerase III subunit beta [Candidatus Uhrbacteria bacterium]
MKFSCTKDNIFQGLASVAHLSNKNVNLPILNNVLLRTKAGGVQLTTTNLEIAVHCQARGKVEQEGEFTVPSKLFFDYVNLLPNERVDMEVVGDQLSIICADNKTKMKGMGATEFPLIPPVSEATIFEVDASEFRAALSQTLFSVASNESRPELAGVLFRFKDHLAGPNTLVLATTDSYRLSERVLVMDEVPGVEPTEVIVPARTLQEVGRILGLFRDDVEGPARLKIALGEAQIVFRYGPVEITSRIIDGHYPDYRQIIPRQFKTETTLPREEFLKAIKTASLFSRTGLFDVRLEFDPVSQMLTARSEDVARGENQAVCRTHMQGEGGEVTVNSRYLQEGLNAMDTPDVFVGFNDAMSPCLLRPAGKDGYLYLVMPIKQ